MVAISMVIFGIGVNRLDYSHETNMPDIEGIEKQVEYLRNIQMEANGVFMENENAQKLINGKEYLKVLEMIHNESYVEEFYRVGFQYKKLEECKGYKMVGGEFYKFSIDLSNKTVLSVEEVENQTPYVKEIEEDGFMDGAYTHVHSLTSMRSYTGVCLPGTQMWLYGFKIESAGDVRLKHDLYPKAQGGGCFMHCIKIEEIYNKENFWFNELENYPESKKAWCSGDKPPRIESEGMIDRELLTCDVSYPRESSKPRNWPSDAGFSYYWDVRVKPNQTVMFDVAVKFRSIENARDTYEKDHDWRIIFTSPPAPYEISGADMKKYDIGAIVVPGTKTCNYHAHNPIVIIKKDVWENAIRSEDVNNTRT